MNEAIVYQVRSVDAFGKQNVVHSYETEEAAKVAIKMMQKRTRKRYVVHPVKNRPAEHWGINFPPNHPKHPDNLKNPPKSRRLS
jgi:hypothetical protein